MSGTVSIHIHTIEGDSATVDVSPEAHIEAVLRQALKDFGIDQSLAGNYFLVYKGQRLSPGQTIESAGIVNGSELILSSQPQVG